MRKRLGGRYRSYAAPFDRVLGPNLISGDSHDQSDRLLGVLVMTPVRLSSLVLAAVSLVGTVACASDADELATCIEGRWTIAPEQPGDAAASLEWLPRSMVVYHVLRSTLEVLTTTGETIEEKPFTLEARDRRHGWLDVQGGGRVEVGMHGTDDPYRGELY